MSSEQDCEEGGGSRRRVGTGAAAAPCPLTLLLARTGPLKFRDVRPGLASVSRGRALLLPPLPGQRLLVLQSGIDATHLPPKAPSALPARATVHVLLRLVLPGPHVSQDAPRG